ncbi:MAPEG family protein [Arenibacterium sp. LLYu02]|uniref:MAPEG family protein n=1 Tax=Arenibacterium sp. LLYu02 TaxID=3404132 RepID=UPI003B21F5F6
MFDTTALYAGALGLLLVYLSMRVVNLRKSFNVSTGGGGHAALELAARVQANCAEYAPIGLLLLALTEAQGAPALAVHGLGLMLLCGRIFHAIGYGRTPSNFKLRVAGMLLTFGMLILASLGLILHALF